MLIDLIELFSLVILASVLQKNFKLPSPITLISVVVLCSLFDIHLFTIGKNQFDSLVILTLPLLITSDALKLQVSDIKKYRYSLFWVAVIAVISSVALGVLFNQISFSHQTLSIPAAIILFCMISATDPVTVGAIFSNFKVPHKLKLLAEGESLFNDATALIIFSLALTAISNPSEISTSFILIKSATVIFGSIFIGIIIGFITTLLLKISDDGFIESTIIILGTYSSYLISEHFHLSGILSVIISVIMAASAIQKILNKDEEDIQKADKTKNFWLLSHAITNKDNHQTILRSIDFLSLFASAALFISIGSIIHLEKLWFYRYEIISIFIISTIVRSLTMIKFAWVSNNLSFMQHVKTHWLGVLTFAGSKGAISILMVHLLPNSFIHKELFENIIIGNIILSTFVYAIALTYIFNKHSKIFEQECLEEEQEHN